jgi:hypothetical protein
MIMVERGNLMKILNLYTDNDGESHFRYIEIDILKKGQGPKESAPIKVAELRFRGGDIVQGSTQNATGWHTVARRQYLVLLSGEMEIEVGDGSKRILHPGDVMLAEDTTGRGHITRGVESNHLVIRFD